MANKSWPVWVGGIAILALLLALGLWGIGPGPTWRNFQRLRVGMMAEEVVAIMGSPTEDKDIQDVPIPAHLGPEDVAAYKKDREVISRLRVWHAKERYIFYTRFDKAGRLSAKWSRDLWDD